MNRIRLPAGTFKSATEFHDWMTSTTKVGKEKHWPGCKTEDISDFLRKGFPDDSLVVFTHADLHPSNIIVSATQLRRIIALFDWRQPG
jgi:aminoglycoside phosphotransferase (APT) family kinase protein